MESPGKTILQILLALDDISAGSKCQVYPTLVFHRRNQGFNSDGERQWFVSTAA